VTSGHDLLIRALGMSGRIARGRGDAAEFLLLWRAKDDGEFVPKADNPRGTHCDILTRPLNERLRTPWEGGP
jgi:hypothetical protein